MPVPLDKRYHTQVSQEKDQSQKVPALHPMWVEDVQFIEYQPPPVVEDRAARDEWFERMTFIEEDLHWLLKQPHDKFWCQVVFDETLHGCIDSFLKSAPREHETWQNLPGGIMQFQEKVHKMIFLVCLRMATHKESKDTFITPDVFGDILYENFIFDVPKLLDLCVLYGAGNGQLLSKMISNIFKNQPKYWEDLETVTETISKVFSDILQKCGCSDSMPGSPQKLDAGPQTCATPSAMPISDFQDVILYFNDTANTLYRFLDIFPESAKKIAKSDLPLKMASAYESLTLAFNDAFRARDWPDVNLKKALVKKFRKSQVLILKAFRSIVFNSSLQPLLELVSKEDKGSNIESYLTVMSSLLHERRFMAHHEHLFPFAEDYDMITQSSVSVDETRLQFLREGIQQAAAFHGAKKQNQSKRDLSNQYTAEDMAMACAFRMDPVGQESDEQGATAGPKVGAVQLESMITNVKDLLPDLGEGFIEVCLEEYNYKIEDVINAVLEDRLMESLQDLDRTMPREVKPIDAGEADNILDKRANVYDHDEFDVFHKDNIDTSKIHMGKREKTADVKSVLDDKSDVDKLRNLYDRYGHEDVESMYDPQLGLYEEGYEDEYDDTYDTNLVGATDADNADDLSARRPNFAPQLLGGTTDSPSSSRGRYDTSESEDSGDERKRRDQFVQDPALLRQKQEERRASQAGRGRRKPQPAQQPRTHDVKGAAKGQGQSSDVLRNRAWKEKNKNKNRKAMSDKKRKV